MLSTKSIKLDWVAVSATNTIDAYQTYLTDHPNGEHVDEANDAIRKINMKYNPRRNRWYRSSHLLPSINTKDEDGIWEAATR